jgi:hypothetical protein
MKNSGILILLLVIFIIFTWVTIAECGEVTVMITTDLHLLGEDCNLYPLKSYANDIIMPLWGYLLKLESDNTITKQFIRSYLSSKWTELLLKYMEKVKPQTLKDIKHKGWKITFVEVLNEDYLTLDGKLKRYAKDEDHAHIIIFEK